MYSAVRCKRLIALSVALNRPQIGHNVLVSKEPVDLAYGHIGNVDIVECAHKHLILYATRKKGFPTCSAVSPGNSFQFFAHAGIGRL